MRLPSLASLIGPLATWEAMRFARRGQVMRARLLVLYLVFIAFVLMPVLWFNRIDPIRLFDGTPHTLSIQEAATFGHNFALAILIAILLAIAALAPGYAAAAIATEKDQQTLPLLLTTLVTNRELVMGKLTAGVGLVLAAAMAAVPVLACVSLFGGVDLNFLITSCLLILSTTFVGATIGAYAGAATENLRSALTRAYLLNTLFFFGGFFPPCVFFSPLSLLYFTSDSGGSIWFRAPLYVVPQCIIGLLFLFAAFRQIRHPNIKHVFPAPDRRPAKLLPTPVRTALVPVSHYEPDPEYQIFRPRGPMEDERPLEWKERSELQRQDSAANTRDFVSTIVGMFMGLALVYGCTLIASRPGVLSVLLMTHPRAPWPPDNGGHHLLIAATLANGIYLVSAAGGLAGVIARENKRKTLDSLLMIPTERSVILKTKVKACMERGWGWLPVAFFAFGFGFAANGGWPIGLAALAYLCGGLAFVAGLGAWLTVHCPSELQAFRFLLPAVVAVVGIPVAIWNQIEWRDPLAWAAFMFAMGMVGLAAAWVAWRRANKELAAYG
ncbi:MAG: hypothetical protein ACJ8C4_14780 [Gemmataceae bacterium]